MGRRLQTLWIDAQLAQFRPGGFARGAFRLRFGGGNASVREHEAQE